MFASVGVMIVPTFDSLEFETQSNLSRFSALTISPLLAMDLEDTVSSDLRAYIPAPVYQIIGIQTGRELNSPTTVTEKSALLFVS